MHSEQKTDILFAIFIASLVSANLLGSKITTIAGIAVSVGIFAYPLTFLVTDIVEEVHGKQKTKFFLVSGIIAQLFVLGIVLIAVALPPADRFSYNEEYRHIFSNSARIIIASLTAFAVSQTHDIWAFAWLKQKTGGKMLWLRNNLSTAASQLIDTTIFMFIAFYRITPQFDIPFLISLIIPYWIFKIIFAVIDTPIVYAGVSWLRNARR